MRILFVAFLLLISPLAQAGSADSLFKTSQHSIYQIRVIDLASGQKASIGSGFSISSDGIIATNYHVIAEALRYPSRYSMEYRDAGGQEGRLSLLAIDVVHDLALVKREGESLAHLKLSSSPTSQGRRIYSMGNPFDLGMTIIEGNFNGYLKYSMHHKVLFSGSLNPGMSGGPALNQDGQVIGINVSTMGDDISFLVPVSYLHQLYQQKGQNRDLHSDIESQLFDNQQAMLAKLMLQAWELQPFGAFIQVPEQIAPFIKCWGNSSKEPKDNYDETYRSCSSDDNIYLASSFRTGKIKFRYHLLSNRKLNPFQFSSLYQQRYKQIYPDLGASEDKNVTAYQCNSSIVELHDSRWKSSFCSRRYKQYPRLNDMMLIMAHLGENGHGTLFSIGVSGVELQAGSNLLKKFSESFQWQK